MLVLSRRLGEKIAVGVDILIQVVSISGNKVKIGIEAPRSMSVDRFEIKERKEQGELRARIDKRELDS